MEEEKQQYQEKMEKSKGGKKMGRDLKVWEQWVENKCCEHSWQVSLGQVGHWEPKVAGC